LWQASGLETAWPLAHIRWMTKKAKFFWYATGFWAVLTVPLAAISFWLLGYDQTMGRLLFAIGGLVVGLAIFWWFSRGKNPETHTRQQ
jgi:hypothetical protein